MLNKLNERTNEVNPNKKIVFSGRLFEVEQEQKENGQVFEIARRPPGVRLIISDKENRRILLTREYRHELQDYDYRLPGGKVFDSLEDLHAWKDQGQDILDAAKAKAIGEGAEEAGVDITELELFQISKLGATVDWDLYVFDVNAWQPHVLGQQLEQGEDIDADTWFSYEEAEQMVYEGKMQEDRIALILLQWLRAQKNSTA